MILTFDEIGRATGAERIACGPGSGVESVSVDSRRLAAGALFVALRGPNFDGHNFLREAAVKGACALLVDDRRRVALVSDHPVSVFAVSDCLEALGRLAAYVRRRNRPCVIAVTGSNGKTTTKEMIAEIMSAQHGPAAVLKNSGNENNLVGVPLTLLKLAAEKVAVVEMGTNAPGEIGRLTGVVDPDVGLITNVGPAHLEGLGSIEGVALEKAAMLKGMRGQTTAVLNADDKMVRPLGDGFQGKVITFGDSGEVRARAIEEIELSGTRVEIVWAAGSIEVTICYVGRHNVANALAAAAAALAVGVSPEAVKAGLENARPIPMRMQVLTTRGGVGLISDCYNANPASVAAALDTLKRMKARRKIAVLGDMCELGADSARFHRQVGQAAAKAGLWRLYLLGDYACEAAGGALEAGLGEERIKLARGHAEIVGELKGEAREGDWILVKGSRSQRMERVVEDLLAGGN